LSSTTPTKPSLAEAEVTKPYKKMAFENKKKRRNEKDRRAEFDHKITKWGQGVNYAPQDA